MLFLSRAYFMKFVVFLLLFLLPATSFAREPATREMALKEALALADTVSEAHAGFQDLLENGNTDDAEKIRALLAPLDQAVERYRALKKRDEQASAINGLGFTTKYSTFIGCGPAGSDLVETLKSYLTVGVDAAKFANSIKYRATDYRRFLFWYRTCQLATGAEPVPAEFNSLADLFSEVMARLSAVEESLLSSHARELLADIADNPERRFEFDWWLNVEIVAPAEVMKVYVGRAMLEKRDEILPFFPCASAHHVFYEVINSINQSIREDPASKIRRHMGGVYLETKRACMELLSR
jgi:hypothetical protein